MQGLTGGAKNTKLSKHLHTAELGSLLLFQLVPHFLIAVSVLVHPETFSAKVGIRVSATPPRQCWAHLGVALPFSSSTPSAMDRERLITKALCLAVLLCNCYSRMRLHQCLQCA